MVGPIARQPSLREIAARPESPRPWFLREFHKITETKGNRLGDIPRSRNFEAGHKIACPRKSGHASERCCSAGKPDDREVLTQMQGPSGKSLNCAGESTPWGQIGGPSDPPGGPSGMQERPGWRSWRLPPGGGPGPPRSPLPSQPRRRPGTIGAWARRILAGYGLPPGFVTRKAADFLLIPLRGPEKARGIGPAGAEKTPKLSRNLWESEKVARRSVGDPAAGRSIMGPPPQPGGPPGPIAGN